MDSKALLCRDGFRVVKTSFIVPPVVNQLELQNKRRLTICNLFVNYQMTIHDVARLLDESYGNVVTTLIELGVIEERRSQPRNPPVSSRQLELRARLKRCS
jgi:hypothetical protein